jgi:hypothetical protein
VSTVSLDASESTFPSECQVCGGQLVSAPLPSGPKPAIAI